MKIKLTFFEIVILWFKSVSLVIVEGKFKSSGLDVPNNAKQNI